MSSWRKKDKRKRKDRKKEKKAEERSSGIYWSLEFEQARGSTGQEASWTTLQEVGVLSYYGYSLSKGHSMAMSYVLTIGLV